LDDIWPCKLLNWKNNNRKIL